MPVSYSWTVRVNWPVVKISVTTKIIWKWQSEHAEKSEFEVSVLSDEKSQKVQIKMEWIGAYDSDKEETIGFVTKKNW